MKNIIRSEKKKKTVMNVSFNIKDILNRNETKNNKISCKVLNTIFENNINTEHNILKNKEFKIGGNIHQVNALKPIIFSNQKSFTKGELRKTMSGYFNLHKRPSINNFREALISKNKQDMDNNLSLKNLNQIKTQNNYIKYDDLYFEDDMFIPESSSFPNEQEEDFLLKLQFIEENNYDEDIIDYNIRNNSVSYNINNNDKIYLRYFKNNIKNDKIFERIFSINSSYLNNLFLDEEEKIGKNILYIEDKRNSSRKNSKINLAKNENNKNDLFETISYISVDLLIKKITIENFRNKFPDIYACFIQQFKYFLPIKDFITKMILAFKYYDDKSIDLSNLIIFFNEIISPNIEIVKSDKELIEKIRLLYLKIKNFKFEEPKYNEDFIKTNYLLFNNNDMNNEPLNKKNNKDKKISIKTNVNLRKVKTTIFKIIKKDKSQDKDIKEIRERGKHNYNYFYIFNYNKEEIAAYLTLDSYQLLSNIPENELFNKNFNRKDKEKVAPNIKKIIERYDKLILFIIEDICSYDHKSERAEIIEKWLRIGLVCMELHNYNDLIMINSLFCNYLLKKMKLTWQKISKKNLNYIEEMNKFCSGTQCYIKIRKEILFKCKGKPYVPYLGILLKEIMGVEEQKYIINNNINIEKLVKLNKIITHFFEFKQNKYSFAKPTKLDILSKINPKKEEQIELIIKQIEPKLTINAKKGDKKRITQTDRYFYKQL